MRLFIALLPAAALLVACASQPEPAPAQQADSGGLTNNVGDAATSAYSQTRDGFTDAALSPLEDLNLKKEPIPSLLKDVKSPYDLPEDLTCLDIQRLLAQLDGVLGPDWDTPNPDERLRTEKLADAASESALSAVASEARGMIPFRSLVRKATGAETYEKKYNQAFKIGAQRRAYLKGMGLAKGCPVPARPNPAPPEQDEIVFKGDSPTPRPVPRSEPQISYGSTPYVIDNEAPQTGLPR
ncbi:MAG: hypothetical protein R3C13_09965 [Hyphomonas sp.]|uniref:hypothetical protein n=1 Tax=Hyphomonas sp. TaxID=87 RepID=UPI003527EDA7